MSKRVRVEVEGVDELMKAFIGAPGRAITLARSANKGIADDIRRKAVANAPRGERPESPVLKKSIKTRRLKNRKNTARSDVYIILGTSRKAKDGAWYWRFPEQGTKLDYNWPPPGVGFIRRAFQGTEPKAPGVFRKKVITGVDKYIKRIARQRGK